MNLRPSPYHWLGFLTVCLALSQTALALQSDSEQPVQIEADHMTLDESQGRTEYHGNVHLTQGSITLTADSVLLHNHDGRINSMLITGNSNLATFKQLTDSGQTAKGQAKRIEYNAQQSRLLLIESAELLQGNNLIRSDRIDYNTETNNLTAGNANNAETQPTTDTTTGSKRVRIVITPDET